MVIDRSAPPHTVISEHGLIGGGANGNRLLTAQIGAILIMLLALLRGQDPSHWAADLAALCSSACLSWR